MNIGLSFGAGLRPLAIGLVLAPLLLSACVPAAPDRSPPFEGLLPGNAQPHPIPNGLPVAAAGKSIAVVTTNSTERYLQYVDDALEAVRKNVPWAYVQDIQAVRPNLVANVVVAELKSKFAKVATEESLASASRGAYDYVAVLDIALKFPDNFNYTYRYEATLYLLDRQDNLLGVISGQAETTNTCMGDPECGPRTAVTVMNQSVAAFRQDFARAVR